MKPLSKAYNFFSTKYMAPATTESPEMVLFAQITLSNCLEKLFNTILYNRHKEKLLNKNVISQAQAGFSKYTQ